eukprot:TRINITY_DN14323_c0_g2_i1.p1 TRINITY_DN14323_c0_g2~~TRINITY_DN14323_c0_g2_i1.p1  ORF type:complete len:723 (+),score=117.53 TRINITY_DN14323_c0_g2_i1:118-2169(+)
MSERRRAPAVVAAAASAVEAVRLAAALPEFVVAVGQERAAGIEQKAANCSWQLLAQDAAVVSDAAKSVCDLVRDSVALATQEPDGASEESDDPAWGCGAAMAEVVSNSLAAAANLLPDFATASLADVATVADLSDDELMAFVEEDRQMVLALLQDISFNLDCLSVHIYGTLCRTETAAAARRGFGSPTAADVRRKLAPPGRLEQSLRGVCVWMLTALARSVGFGNLTTATLWEWAHGDALWASVVVKAVVDFGGEDPTGLCGVDSGAQLILMPTDLATLRGKVLKAALGLSTPSVAFEAWRDIQSPSDNDVSIAAREVALSRHRGQLAEAVVACGLAATLVDEAQAPACDAECLPALASFLAAIARPVQSALSGDPAVWADGGEEDLSFSAVCQAAARLCAQLRHHAEVLWVSLATVPESVIGTALEQHSRACCLCNSTFLRDCAILAHAVAPSVSTCGRFLDAACLLLFASSSFVRDTTRWLVALATLAANAGVQPSSSVALMRAFGSLSPASRSRIAQEMAAWPWPIQAASLEQWTVAVRALDGASDSIGTLETAESMVGQEAQAAHTVEIAIAAPQISVPVSVVSPPSLRTDLRSLVIGAPVELCCALDGQLLIDPVRSPHGNVFERSVLAEALEREPFRCPLTGLPLPAGLGDCPRATEVRRSVTRWVRQQRVGRGIAA